MIDMIGKVENKLLEYGFAIYDQHPEKNDTYVFLTEDMILFVHDNNTTISVSFQATTKPEVVARRMLILKEIKGLESLRVMESFIFTSNKDMLHGDKAFEAVEKIRKSKAIKEYHQSMEYKSILTRNDSEFYSC